jgi:hypothetical protein
MLQLTSTSYERIQYKDDDDVFILPIINAQKGRVNLRK